MRYWKCEGEDFLKTMNSSIFGLLNLSLFCDEFMDLKPEFTTLIENDRSHLSSTIFNLFVNLRIEF